MVGVGCTTYRPKTEVGKLQLTSINNDGPTVDQYVVMLFYTTLIII